MKLHGQASTRPFTEKESALSAVKGQPAQGKGWLDKLAIGFAGVCGIHCLLSPVLLVLFPIIGSTFFVNEQFHLWLLLAVVPTTVIAITLGCRKHKDKYVFLLSSLGLVLIVIAAVWGHGHELHNLLSGGELKPDRHAHEAWATWVTVAGAFLMVSGHFRNYRLCRTDHCTHEH